jgi:MoaA/NifB/PqqE/SkfB family radical SAM enzyme
MAAEERSSGSGPPGNEELVVVARVYTRCTLGCLFCGYSGALRRDRPVAERRRLLALGAALAGFQQRHGRSVLVCWLGGEPLEWPELPRLAGVFRGRYGLRLGVATNGLPLGAAAVRQELIANYEQLTVSLDGRAPFHEQVRGQAGLFARVRTHVARLQAEDVAGRLRWRVNTVLMRDNIGAFGEFCAEMAEWGFQELTFNPLGGRERPDFYRDHHLLPEQVDRFRAELPGLRRALAARGLQIRGSDRYLHRMACTAAGQRIAVGDCQPGRQFLFVDEFNRASPCAFACADYAVPLAELDSPEAWRALPERWARCRRRRRAAACDDCQAPHVFAKFGVT